MMSAAAIISRDIFDVTLRDAAQRVMMLLMPPRLPKMLSDAPLYEMTI